MDQIRYYFSEIERVTRRYFYFKQWKETTVPFENVVVREADYPVGKDWSLILSQQCKVQQRFAKSEFVRGHIAAKKDDRPPVVLQSIRGDVGCCACGRSSSIRTRVSLLFIVLETANIFLQSYVAYDLQPGCSSDPRHAVFALGFSNDFPVDSSTNSTQQSDERHGSEFRWTVDKD